MDPVTTTVIAIFAVVAVSAFVFVISMKWPAIRAKIQKDGQPGRKGRIPLKVPPVTRQQFLKVFNSKRGSRQVTIEKDPVLLEDGVSEESGDHREAKKCSMEVETPSSLLEGGSVYYLQKRLSEGRVGSTPKIPNGNEERVEKPSELMKNEDGDSRKYLLLVQKAGFYVTVTEEDVAADVAAKNAKANVNLTSVSDDQSQELSAETSSIISETGGDSVKTARTQTASGSGTISAVSQLGQESACDVSGDDMPSKAESLRSLHYNEDESESVSSGVTGKCSSEGRSQWPTSHESFDKPLICSGQEGQQHGLGAEKGYQVERKPGKLDLSTDFRHLSMPAGAHARSGYNAAGDGKMGQRNEPSWRRGKDGCEFHDDAGRRSHWSHDGYEDRYLSSGRVRGRVQHRQHAGGWRGKKLHGDEYGQFHGRPGRRSSFGGRGRSSGRGRRRHGGSWSHFDSHVW